MDLDLEEQEQLANLKAFWQDYGRWLAIGVIIALIGSAIYWFYRHQQESHALDASKQYEQLLTQLEKNNLPEVLAQTQKLQADYAGTAYAAMAGLLAANLANSVNDKDAALTQLDWVTNHAKSDAFAALAKLRLVTLLIDQNKPESFDKADKLLNTKAVAGFEALQQEKRGDWYWAQNQTAEAKKAYLEAWKLLADVQFKASGLKEMDANFMLSQQQNPGPDQRLLKAKIDSLGGF
jgi:predicted negative regulator of RcsB-dependent stress response